ncbi:MAG TPA: undecaprenyl/decaprenyl-phosphate alpha-N-acetylglucosaminyl 1-phosphate transferase [Firmicutes bacterium]|nr:undecaprenyl/decaprenyl-phosphate alpha-N-acetylglucosaminyl 1-phosphate transferase [Bacillota bacterium]
MSWHQVVYYYPRVFLVALVGAYLATHLVRWLAVRVGLMDVPDVRKTHRSPVALGGGVAIYFAFALAVYLTRYYDRPLQGIVLGGFLMLVVGLIDDWRGGIPATLKFFILVALTIFLTFPPFNVILNLTKIYVVDAGLTILWIVGITSAFNAVDNMDGQAAGLGAIAAGAFALVALETQNLFMGMLSLGVMGSCLGFLPHNFSSRGKVFMGDAGSFTLGYLLAAISIIGEWSDSKVVSCTIPVLILAVPIFDLTYVVLYRYFTGVTSGLRQALTHCAQDHLAHRLVALGATPRQAVLFIYFIATCLALGGVVLRTNTALLSSSLHVVQALMILAIVVILMRQSLKNGSRNRQLESELHRLRRRYGESPPSG